MALKTKLDDKVVDLAEAIAESGLKQRSTTFGILGTTPLLFNRMSEKAKHQLLLPSPKMNQAEKDANIKHDPFGEFRGSVYFPHNGEGCILPSNAFTQSCASAALRIPGTTKTEIGQLVGCRSKNIVIYGLPRLHMAVVRQAGITRAPDIRTRACIERWGCLLKLWWMEPRLSHKAVLTLLMTAGIIIGVGDGRKEKGTFDYGSFEIVNEDDAELVELQKTCGKAEQQFALAHPQCYDEESQELFDWYSDEIQRRGRDKGTAPRPKRRGKNGVEETVGSA